MEGTNGRDQEALLDYCHRLALAHRVRITDLLKAEIIPRTLISGALSTSRFSTEYAKTFNGYGKYATQVTECLQDLTGQTSLSCGTFLHWKPMLDHKGAGLLHPLRRWCPSCIAQAQDGGRPITYALIWSASIITHCPTHLTQLRQSCEACGATQPFISDHVPLGRCAQCDSPLGAREGLWGSDAPSERQLFFSNTVAEMIALGKRAQELARPEIFARSLKEVILSNFDGSNVKFEKEIGFRKNSISKWLRLEARPQFDLLMEVCYRIMVSPVDLLSGTFSSSGKTCEVRKCDVPVVKPRQRPSVTLESAIKSDVEIILQSESEYVEAVALAKKHGITVGYFKYWFPLHYQKITGHRRYVQSLQSKARVNALVARTQEKVRELYSIRPRMSRRQIGVALQSVGISMKDPRVRKAALEERDHLQSQLLENLQLQSEKNCR
jgi:hypothetical protein